MTDSAPPDATAVRTSLVEARLEIVRSVVREHGGGGGLLTSRRDLAWLTVGGLFHVVAASEAAAGSILVTQDRAVLVAPVNEAPRFVAEEIPALPFDVEEVPWEQPGAVTSTAERLAGGALVPADALEAALGTHRPLLEPVEHDRMRWLAERARAALDMAASALAPGIPELDVVAAMEAALLRDGVRAPVVLAAADDRLVRFRHPIPTATPVHRRLMVVIVAENWGLHVAATRILDLEPPDHEIRRRDKGVAAVHRAMLGATRERSTLGAVIEAAQAAYAAAGHPDEWRLHHQGGSIGYGPRERIATPGDPTPIRVGEAFAWNPSITGAKMESTVILGSQGLETILD